MKKKILLVDDEEDILDILTIVIEDFSADVEIITKSDAKEALSIIKKDQIDLVITDLHMPGMSGTDFLKEISLMEKENRPKNILVLSGFIKVKSDYHTDLNMATMSKPFTSEELAGFLSRTIGKAIQEFNFDEKTKPEFVKFLKLIQEKFKSFEMIFQKDPNHAKAYTLISLLLYKTFMKSTEIEFYDFADYINALHKLFAAAEEKSLLDIAQKAIDFIPDAIANFQKVIDSINDPNALNQLSLTLKSDIVKIAKVTQDIEKK